jgi:hypothetical protein
MLEQISLTDNALDPRIHQITSTESVNSFTLPDSKSKARRTFYISLTAIRQADNSSSGIDRGFISQTFVCDATNLTNV